ncbi:MAG: serine--tRNA ligase [Gemmatimonadales bacterium]|nr:MAG: serine--tRNA ligase [Gemmatimonadales bacterium]
MLDLKLLRSDPQQVRRALARRGDAGNAGMVDEILALDEERRAAITESDALKARRNEVSRTVGERKRAGEDAEALILEMREVGTRISELDAGVSAADARIQEVLLATPNLPLDEVPEGDESHNELLRDWGIPVVHPFQARPHWELGESLGILDLPRGAKVSGSGFPVLRGAGARLQRGLINWMLDLHVQEHGYEELRVPYLVTRETLTGTGQLPKFADESYLSERDDLWLIPTAEVPVTNLHRDELLTADDLPIRYTAYSPCFRREAGAAGKDTRGLLRVHQFDKVELVRFEHPDRSRQALEELTEEAERILQELGLAYRVVRLASGDLGFSSAMTYDIEVWAPGVERWLEVSSCSIFTDYQARRAGIRFRPAPGEKPEFVHTLNGSALALPRLMVALLETYQEEDGSVALPEVIHRWFGEKRLVPPDARTSGAPV